MAYTQADLDKIKAAIARGTLSWSHNGRSETYRSMDEMIQAKNLIEAEINASETTPRQYPRHQLASFADD